MQKKFLFLITFLIFLTPVVVFSQENALSYIEANDDGKDVMSLFEIERLIRATDYNEALKQLHIYIQAYPDRFDNAQRLIKTIMTRRQRYSVLTERAIKSSTENPEDHETPSKIILEMKTLEKNPPEEIQTVITLLQDMHLFKYYAYLFETIQKESAGLAEKNEVLPAIEKVKEGFWVYKDEFLDEWANNQSIIKEAERIEERLNGYIDSFESQEFRRRFTNVINTFIKNVDDDKYEAARESFTQVQQVLKEYSQIRNNIFDCAQSYKDLYEKQKKIRPDITDASYIPFMQRYVSGLSSIPDSGIVGAIDCEWNNRVEAMKTAVAKTELKKVNDYLASLPKAVTDEKANLEPLRTAGTYTRSISNYADLGIKVNALYGNLKTGDRSTYSPYADYNSALTFASGISKQKENLYPIVRDLKAETETQKQIKAEMDANKNNPDYDSSVYIRRLFDSVAKMDRLTGNGKSLKLSDSKDVKSQNCSMDWTKSQALYNNYVNEIYSTTENAVKTSWNEISQSFIHDAASYENVIKEYNKYASVYSKGFPEKIDEATFKKISGDPVALIEYAKAHENSSTGEVYYYPDLSLNMTQYVQTVSDKYEDAMASAQKEFEYNLENHPEWKQNREITSIVNRSQEYMEKKSVELSQMKKENSTLIAQAQDAQRRATASKNEADNLYSQSQAAFNRGDLDRAEKLLVSSSEKYAESLLIQENPVLRKTADQKNFELSSKITDARNEIVVRESRALYTKARESQSYDLYDDAETYINAAINKWAETHDEKNEEFEDFRQVVNTAVSMKTGRILLASDPLYAEMSQILNIAYQYYDEGTKLYTKGQKEAGNEKLDLALENLNKIKKVYPINQEASLLLLKIDQLRDPAKFNAEFGQKVKDAVAKCKKADTQTEGYNALINYYNISPNYKGLKQTINDIEIQLGMRQKPVDNSAINRAKKLTADAQTIYNSAGSNVTKLNQALDKVNQALKLNPTYSAAENLKDKIATKLGGSTTIVLNAEDTALLTRAKNEYQAGRIDEANLLMIQILRNNPQNIKVKSVSDLKKKIDARL